MSLEPIWHSIPVSISLCVSRFWQEDEGHPNAVVERILEMNSEELSEEMDRTMEDG